MKKELHSSKIRKNNEYSIDNDIVTVKLSNSNKSFICDLEEWNNKKQYCWALHHTGYAYTTIDSKYITFHESLYIYDKNINQIDHVNLNRLDNRRVNLRMVTKSQNMMNRDIISSNTSGCTGVHYNSKNGLWVARIGVNYKRIVLGSYSDINEAIKVRKEAEIKYFGEHRFKAS
jgi:hypothetical protein